METSNTKELSTEILEKYLGLIGREANLDNSVTIANAVTELLVTSSKSASQLLVLLLFTTVNPYIAIDVKKVLNSRKSPGEVSESNSTK